MTADPEQSDPASTQADRRSSPRFAPVNPEARIAWGPGRPPFQTLSAQMIDISEGGAQLRTSSLPPGLSRVWVRLDALPWEWVGATVLSVHACRGSRSQCSLHLAFSEPCPPGVLEHAVAPEPEAEEEPLESALTLSHWFE